MAKNEQLERGLKLERTLEIEVRNDGEDNRTVELSFSSEQGVERYFGEEVLDHNPQSVRLDRLNNGAAVLVNHDSDDQVGVVESARIDDDGRGRAVIRFSKSARGSEIYEDVKDGIRRLVSVGYRIHDYKESKRDGKSPLVRVTDWEPYEISIVPIPADAGVGVGRSEKTELAEAEERKAEPHTEKVNKMTEEVKSVEAPAINTKEIMEKTRGEELARINSIRALGEKNDLDGLAADAISRGDTVEQFKDVVLEKIGERNNAARSKQTEEADVDLSRKEEKQFSFVRLMDALSNPNDKAAQSRAGFELEVCADAEAKMPSGFNARGIYVPPSLMRDLSAGTATDGAELVADNLLAGSYIEVLRNNMTAMQAGARMLPGLVGNVDIPRQTSGASATWISAEDGDATESEPQFDQVSLTPKDLAAYTEVTRRLTQQSTPAIEGIVRNDLFEAIALGLDSAVFYGSGASGQPQGIDGATGVADPTFASATAPTYAEMRTMMKTIMASNAAQNLMYIISPDTWEQLGGTPKQASGVEGNFVLSEMTDSILGRPYMVSTQLAADDFVLGDFSNILIGDWGGIELNVDPYTHSLKGKTRYVVFKTCDVAIRHPEAFSFHNAA